jgi:hypothetical protein
MDGGQIFNYTTGISIRNGNSLINQMNYTYALLQQYNAWPKQIKK